MWVFHIESFVASNPFIKHTIHAILSLDPSTLINKRIMIIIYWSSFIHLAGKIYKGAALGDHGFGLFHTALLGCFVGLAFIHTHLFHKNPKSAYLQQTSLEWDYLWSNCSNHLNIKDEIKHTEHVAYSFQCTVAALMGWISGNLKPISAKKIFS